MSADVFVVVRGAGERTAEAALALARAEVGAEAVTAIREVPFAAALRRGFETGVAAGRRWTLCLDADVLLRPGAIAELVAAAEAAPAAVFGATGTVADKLLGHVRAAGQHLYRTGLLSRALETCPFDPAKRRPETVVKKTMARDGHPTVAAPVVMGLHDFEQSYADIYRKVFVHTRKHVRFLPAMRRAWARQAGADADFAVALVSAAAADAVGAIAAAPAQRADESVCIDRAAFPDEISPLLMPLGLTEKPPLAATAWDGEAVEAALARFEESPEYLAARPLIEAAALGPYGQALARLRRHGAAAPVWFAGAALERRRLAPPHQRRSGALSHAGRRAGRPLRGVF